MRRVLDGGDGCDSGGIDVRSIDRGERDLFFERPPGEDEADIGGEFVGECWVCMEDGVRLAAWAMVSAVAGCWLLIADGTWMRNAR
jgi:hypothetical protein